MVEIWKDIPGYEGIYKISNNGVVESIGARIKCGDHFRNTKKKILKPHLISGYNFVTLYKDGRFKNTRIHRVLAVLFIPNPERKACVNHKDGNRANNSLDNLEWVTHSENTLHAFRTNLMKNIGETHYRAKLKKEDVLKIREMLAEGKLSQSEIGKIYSVGPRCISKINKKVNWKEI